MKAHNLVAASLDLERSITEQTVAVSRMGNAQRVERLLSCAAPSMHAPTEDDEWVAQVLGMTLSAYWLMRRDRHDDQTCPCRGRTTIRRIEPRYQRLPYDRDIEQSGGRVQQTWRIMWAGPDSDHPVESDDYWIDVDFRKTIENIRSRSR